MSRREPETSLKPLPAPTLAGTVPVLLEHVFYR